MILLHQWWFRSLCQCRWHLQVSSEVSASVDDTFKCHSWPKGFTQPPWQRFCGGAPLVVYVRAALCPGAAPQNWMTEQFLNNPPGTCSVLILMSSSSWMRFVLRRPASLNELSLQKCCPAHAEDIKWKQKNWHFYLNCYVEFISNYNNKFESADLWNWS